MFAGYDHCRTDLELISLAASTQEGGYITWPRTPAPPPSPTATKSTARKSTARKTHRSQDAGPQHERSQHQRRATTRSTATKSPSRPAAKGTRTRAKNQTRQAAGANAQAAKVTAKQGRNVAERAALVYVGGVLEARDRVIGVATGIVDKYGSVSSAQKTLKRSQREIEKDVRRFERRGEREAKLARTRVERLVRRNRRAFERDVNVAERKAGRRDNVVTERLAGVSKAVTGVSKNVEEAVQVGVATGERLAEPRQGVRVGSAPSPGPAQESGSPGKPAGLIFRRWGSSALIPWPVDAVSLLPQPSPSLQGAAMVL